MRCNYCFTLYTVGEVCPECGYEKGGAAKELFYLRPGTTLNNGRYIIGQVIGVGGFGIVYKAWDTANDTPVAIKEYYPNGLVVRTPGTGQLNLVASSCETEFDAGRRRFAMECVGITQLDKQFRHNPSILHNISHFNSNGTTYLVMEYVQGITVTKYIKDNGSFPLNTGLNVIFRLLDAVRDINSIDIIHRDINPDNIILSEDGTVKLIDFGAAIFGKRYNLKSVERVMKLGYSPPEQYDINGHTGITTDIYSIGATLYLMLTGLKPDEATNRKKSDLLASPAILNPEIPQNISNAILQAMALDHKLRFKNAEKFLKALTVQRG